MRSSCGMYLSERRMWRWHCLHAAMHMHDTAPTVLRYTSHLPSLPPPSPHRCDPKTPFQLHIRRAPGPQHAPLAQRLALADAMMGAPHRAKLQQLRELYECPHDGPGAVGHEYRCAKREDNTYDHETWLAMMVRGWRGWGWGWLFACVAGCMGGTGWLAMTVRGWWGWRWCCWLVWLAAWADRAGWL